MATDLVRPGLEDLPHTEKVAESGRARLQIPPALPQCQLVPAPPQKETIGGESVPIRQSASGDLTGLCCHCLWLVLLSVVIGNDLADLSYRARAYENMFVKKKHQTVNCF